MNMYVSQLRYIIMLQKVPLQKQTKTKNPQTAETGE